MPTGVLWGSMKRIALLRDEEKQRTEAADSPTGTAGFARLRAVAVTRALCFDPTMRSSSESTSEPSPFSPKPCVFAQNRYRPAMTRLAFQWLEHSERYGNSFSSI